MLCKQKGRRDLQPLWTRWEKSYLCSCVQVHDNAAPNKSLAPLPPICWLWNPTGLITLVSVLREICCYPHHNLPFGLTNEEVLSTTIKQIFDAVAGDSNLQHKGVAHYPLPLLLVMLVYLPVFIFACVSNTKNTKKISYFVPSLLRVVFIMSSFFTVSVAPEAEVLNLKQMVGESLKDAWYMINDSRSRATTKQSTTILLRNFMLILLLGIDLF